MFWVPRLDGWFLIVRGSFADELRRAPQSVLSLGAAVKEVCIKFSDTLEFQLNSSSLVATANTIYSGTLDFVGPMARRGGQAQGTNNPAHIPVPNLGRLI
jgi:hypothetical protein